MKDTKSIVGQFESEGKIGQDNSTVLNSTESSSPLFKEQIQSIKLYEYKTTIQNLIDLKSFGQNTHITGGVGEVLEATGCDTTKKMGRIEASEKIEAIDSDDYGKITLSKNTGLSNRSLSMLTFWGIKRLDTSETFDSLNHLKLKSVQDSSIWGASFLSWFPNAPIVVPWKTYNDNTDDDSKWLIVGPISIPFLNSLNGDGSTTGTIDGVVNRSIAMKFVSNTNGRIDKEYTGAGGVESLKHDSKPKNGKLKGLKVRWTGTGDAASRLKVTSSYIPDTLKTITEVVSDIAKDTPTTMYLETNNIASLKLEYSDSGSFNDTENFNFTKIWYSTLYGEYNPRSYPKSELPTRPYQHNKVFYYFAVNTFVVEPPNLPGLQVWISSYYDDGSSTGWHEARMSGGVSLGYDSEDIVGLNAYVGDLDETFTDPVLEAQTALTPTFSRFENVYAAKGSVVIDIAIETLSGGITEGSLTDKTRVDSSVGLAHITSVVGDAVDQPENETDVKIMVEDARAYDFPTETTMHNDIYRDSTIYKIHRLSARYLLTFVESSFSVEGVTVKYFGMYDTVSESHYTPQNFYEHLKYLPQSLSDELSEINVISDTGNDLSVTITLNDKTTFYLTIVRVDSFNAGKIYKDSTYKAQKTLTMMRIQDGTVANVDKDFELFVLFSASITKHSDRFLKRPVTLFNGNTDLMYERSSKDTNTNFGPGTAIFSSTKYLTTESVALIREPVSFVSGSYVLPMLLPSTAISFTNPDVTAIDFPSPATDINDVTDPSKNMYWFKLAMIYNFENDIGLGISARGFFGLGLLPSAGSVCLLNMPSIDGETRTYTALPEKATDYFGIDYLSNLNNIGTKVVPANNKTFVYSGSNLYESSNLKLVPSGTKPLLDKSGTISSSGNIVAVTTDNPSETDQVSTSFYQIDRNSYANYILSVPDRIISNIVHMASGIVFVCSTGIYMLTQNAYDKIYEFPIEIENAAIRAMNGIDFVIFAYTTQGISTAYSCTDGDYPCSDGIYPVSERAGNSRLYRINKYMHISELETDNNLSKYNIITSNNNVTDNISLIDVDTSTIVTLGFGSTLSTPTFKFRPIEITTQSDDVFVADKLYFCTYGYGTVTVKIGDTVTDIYDNTASPLVCNASNDDRYSCTLLEFGPVTFDHKEIWLTFSDTLKIDKIKIAGTFLHRT